MSKNAQVSFNAQAPCLLYLIFFLSSELMDFAVAYIATTFVVPIFACISSCIVLRLIPAVSCTEYNTRAFDFLWKITRQAAGIVTVFGEFLAGFSCYTFKPALIHSLRCNRSADTQNEKDQTCSLKRFHAFRTLKYVFKN